MPDRIQTGALLFIVAICVALSGCSPPPSAGDGKQAIEDRISKDSAGRIKLTAFRKTDAQQGELMGIKFYGLEFEAEIEFLENCKWVTGLMGQQITFRTVKPNSSASPTVQLMEAAENPGMQVSKGDRMHLVGVVRFVKKESGWVVEGVNVSTAMVLQSATNVVPQTAQKEDSDPLALKSFDTNASACLSQLSSLLFTLKLTAVRPPLAMPGTPPQTAAVPGSELPTDLRTLRERCSTPDGLFCPADKKRKPVTDWAAVGSNGVSYDFVGTGQNKNDPWIKCPIHGFILSSSSKITTSEGSTAIHLRTGEWIEGKEANGITMVKLKNGEWADVRSVFTNTVSAAEKAEIDRKKTAAVKAQLNSFRTAIDAFQVDNSFYPKNGLIDLERAPQDTPTWRGPYLISLSKDLWGNDYIYQCPGTHNPTSYDLMSMGPDGHVGGGDDITNWK